MASTIVELLAPAGLTLTLELYPEGSDTIANGAGDTLTEATNRDGLYTATVTEALAGYYYAKVIDGSSNLISAGWVKLVDDTNTYTVGERVVAIEGAKRQLDDLNDIAATDIVSSGAITTSGGAVSTVTTVTTCTTNTDMRGTDNALLAASAPANFGDLAITVTTGQVTVGTNNDKTGYSISGTKTTLDDLNDVSSASVADAVWDASASDHTVSGSFGRKVKNLGEGLVAAEGEVNDLSATTSSFVTNLSEATDDHYRDAVLSFVSGALIGQSRTISSYDGTTKTVTLDQALTEAPTNADEFLILTSHQYTAAEIASVVLTTQMTESYAADGTAPTLAQAQFAIQQFLQETNVSGTTLTVKKLDGSTTAMTFTLDDATSPTSLTRAT
jgi:hypothetical protein